MDFTSREKLYNLLAQFFANKIGVIQFVNEFTDTYNLELDYETLSDAEQKLFRELVTVTSRFSPYKEDILKYSAHFNEQQVRDKAKQIALLLKEL